MRKIRFEEDKKTKIFSIKRILTTIFFIVLTSFVVNNTYNYNKIIKENNIVFTKIQDTAYNPADLIQANVIVSTIHAGGSGSIIKVEEKATFVLTAAHVVSAIKIERNHKGRLEKKLVPARNITIIHKQGKTKAEIIKIDYSIDVAVVKIYKKINVNPIIIAKEEPGLGETVWSISNPGMHKDIVSKGIFSGINGDQSIVSIAGFFGSSGGMVINNNGKQIGVISTIWVAKIGRHFPSLTIYNGITRTEDLNKFLKEILENE